MLRRFIFLVLVILATGLTHPATAQSITWQSAWSDNFTLTPASGSRSVTFPTTAGSAGSTTAVANTWDDIHGGVWNLPSSGVLQATNDTTNGNSYQRDFLTLPTSVDPTVNSSERMVFTTVAASTNASTWSWACGLRWRYSSSASYYLFALNSGYLQIYSIVSGSGTLVHQYSISGYNSTHVYQVDAQAYYVSPTYLATEVTDETTSTVVVNSTGSPLTDSTSSLQSVGQYCLVPYTGSGTANEYSNAIAYTSGPIVAGQISVTSYTQTSAVLACTAAVGGTGSGYTYQWYASTTGPTFTPGSGNILSGQTSLTPTVTLPSYPTITYYKVIATDSGSNTSTSADYPVVAASRAALVIGAGGDSISAYNLLTPPNTPVSYMGWMLQCWGTGFRQVTTVDEAVFGTTTATWLPSDTTTETTPGNISTNAYNTAVTAWHAAGVTDIQFMLGTNDSVQGISATTFQSNYQTIITALQAAFPGVVIMIHASPFNLPVTGNTGTYYDSAISLITQYATTSIPALVAANANVVAGDTKAFMNTALYPSLLGGVTGTDGKHPTTPYAVSVLGSLWASAWASYLGISPSAASGSIGRGRIIN